MEGPTLTLKSADSVMLNVTFVKKGHIASVCRAKQSPKSRGKARKTSGGKNHGPRPPSTKWVDAAEPETGEDDLQLYVIGEQSTHPYYVDMSVNGKKLSMEIDTGASFSSISEI